MAGVLPKPLPPGAIDDAPGASGEGAPEGSAANRASERPFTPALFRKKREPGAWQYALASIALTTPAWGQVITDGTLGPQHNLAGPNYAITQDLGATRGANLFHSFRQFDLPKNTTARFSGDASIRNVLARITSGQPSAIRGTIASDIAGADLYLINPAGIAFGPGAALDVSGSFVATTADTVRLADGTTFGLTTAAPVLTSAAPESFGFLSPPQAGRIGVDGTTLRVAAPKTLALVGGQLRIQNAFLSSDGRVNLISAGPGARVTQALGGRPAVEGGARADVDLYKTLSISQSLALVGRNVHLGQSQILAGSLTEQVADPTILDATGDVLFVEGNLATLTTTFIGPAIELKAASLTLNSATSLGISASTASTGRAGDVTVEVSGPVTLLNGARIQTFASTGGAGGDLTLRAGTLTIDSRGRDPLKVPIASVAAQPSIGGSAVARSGSLEIDVGALRMVGGEIAASSIAATDANPITIRATRSIHLSDDAVINGQTGSLLAPGTGRGGDIRVSAPYLRLDSGASISVSSLDSGSGGDIVVRAGRVELDGGEMSANIFGNAAPGARGGSIDIEADAITLLRQSNLSAATDGTAAGGSVRVRARESILIDGTPDAQAELRGPAVFVTTIGVGDAGTVALTAPQIEMTWLSLVGADSFGTGRGGTVTIDAGSLLIDRGSSVVARTGGAAPGGNVRVAAEDVRVQRLGEIGASSRGAGRAGNVEVAAGEQLILTSRGQVTVAAPQAQAGDITLRGLEIRMTDDAVVSAEGRSGGNITLLAPDLVSIADSTITARADENGAQILIDPQFVILDNSTINGLAGGQDVRVEIVADEFIRSTDSAILTDTASLPPDVDIAGDLVGLRTALADSAARLREACRVLLRDVSTFVSTGRGGLPPEPGGWLASPNVVDAMNREDAK